MALVEVPIKLGVENALLRQIGLPFQAYKEAIKAWVVATCTGEIATASSISMMVHAWSIAADRFRRLVSPPDESMSVDLTVLIHFGGCPKSYSFRSTYDKIFPPIINNPLRVVVQSTCVKLT